MAKPGRYGSSDFSEDATTNRPQNKVTDPAPSRGVESLPSFDDHNVAASSSPKTWIVRLLEDSRDARLALYPVTLALLVIAWLWIAFPLYIFVGVYVGNWLWENNIHTDTLELASWIVVLGCPVFIIVWLLFNRPGSGANASRGADMIIKAAVWAFAGPTCLLSVVVYYVWKFIRRRSQRKFIRNRIRPNA